MLSRELSQFEASVGRLGDQLHRSQSRRQNYERSVGEFQLRLQRRWGERSGSELLENLEMRDD